MKKPIKYLVEQAAQTQRLYQKRNAMFKAMDDMINGHWTSGVDLAYIRDTISPAPANAINAAIKVLSAERPNPKVTPVGPHPDDRATANKLERGLSWELKNAVDRSQTKLVPDIIRSALLYGEVALYIDYLPQRLEADSSPRMRRIMGRGNFALVIHNPATVYPTYSPLGLESVLVCKKMSGYEVVNYWGEAAGKLKSKLEDHKDDLEVTYYDYTDDYQRAVWVTLADGGDELVILDEARDSGFIPWVVRMTGTSMETAPENQRMPFLNTVYRTRMWENLNLSKTLMNSEIFAYAAAPRGKKEGPNPDSIEVDYGDVGRDVIVPPGHNWTPQMPPQIDRAVTELHDRTKSDLDAATSVQVLENLNFPAGTAFATVNAVLQTAINSLTPYKMLAEVALADAFKIMLYWIDEMDGSILAYGTGGEDRGQQYEITRQDFSTNALYIDVELNASAPTDRMQRINAGALMLQMQYPRSRVFEELGIADPEQAIREYYQEQLVEAKFGLRIQQMQLDAQAAAQQMAMQGQPPPEQMLQGPPPSPSFSNVAGSGFDPNMSGLPPNVAATGLTREQITGMTTGGQELAE